MIYLDSISYTVGNVPVLREITLTIRENEHFALLGPNGSGKSSLIGLLLQFSRPDSGIIRLGSDSFSAVKPHLGVLFEHPALWTTCTVKEMLIYLCAVHNIRYGAVAALLKELDLERLQDRYIKVLSKGEKQRLGIVCALIHDPSILILDEPTSGLDPFMRQNVWAVLTHRPRTIFFSSQLWTEAQEHAQRTAFIAHGRILAVDDTDRLLAPPYVDSTRKLELPKSQAVLQLIRDYQYYETRESCLVFSPEPAQLRQSLDGTTPCRETAVSLEDVFRLLEKSA